MKSIICTIVGLGLVLGTHAQTFQPVDTVGYGLSDDVYGQVVDFDGDGHMDYLFFRRDTVGGNVSAYMLSPDSLLADTLNISRVTDTRFYLADINNDSKLDMLVSALDSGRHMSVLYYQQDSMKFNTEIIDTIRIEKAAFPDLNNDGKKEIVYSTGDDSLRIKQRQDGTWMTYTDSITQAGLDDWLIYDFNADGWQDLLITFVADTARVRFFQNHRGVFVDPDSTMDLASSGHLQGVDYNNDGLPDLLNAGNTSLQGFSINLINQDTAFTIALTPALNDFDIFAADFNSDGLLDIHLTGNYGDTTSIMQLYINQGEADFVLVEELSTQGTFRSSIGDLDTDGDLDRITHRSDTSRHEIQIFDNGTSERNQGPLLVEQHYSFSIPSGLILSWSDAEDDHTPAAAITYDIAIGTDPFEADMLAGNFSLLDTRRFLPIAGNAGSRNELRVNDLPPASYSYGIQSVDNAFHYHTAGEGSGSGHVHCNGRAMACGEFTVCKSFEFETHYVCTGDSLMLSLGYSTAWYSVNKGFLGVYDSLFIQPLAADTLYTSATDCSMATDFVIKVIDEKNLLASSDTVLCEGDLLELEVFGADSIEWASAQGTVLSVSNKLTMSVLADEMIYVTAYYKRCIVMDSIQVRKSKPVIGGLESEYKVTKGESVRFNLTPGHAYKWSPETWLSNAFIHNPDASPRQSLQYVVTAYDSLGCTASDTVSVTVIDKGWIPDLFTPNGDGFNDELKIFGLQNVRDFHFVVYTRSGNRVFETGNVSEITLRGWDGTQSGKPLPNGVYSWRISGVLDDYSPALLNGKDKGVVYIIR